MQMTFRWYGADDPIPLQHIRQIPGVRGVVSALYDVPVGETWPAESVARLADTIDGAGLEFSVLESIPVHEDIKLGRPTRDRVFFAHDGGGRLLVDQGTPTGSRVIEAANGYAAIEMVPPRAGERASVEARTQDVNGTRIVVAPQ